MTTLIAGTVEIDATDRDQALADAAAPLAQTRSQQGCQHYLWRADSTCDTRIYVFENRDSTDDILVSKFRVAHQQPVYDPQGKPRADFGA